MSTIGLASVKPCEPEQNRIWQWLDEAQVTSHDQEPVYSVVRNHESDAVWWKGSCSWRCSNICHDCECCIICIADHTTDEVHKERIGVSTEIQCQETFSESNDVNGLKYPARLGHIVNRTHEHWHTLAYTGMQTGMHWKQHYCARNRSTEVIRVPR